ncbi:MAG: type IV pilus biogenesis/stability protein PilW [Nitrococcus mobilis]|nr:type IV pilus biogenesis/stability protein PilW [Nitrococcus mobilis]
MRRYATALLTVCHILLAAGCATDSEPRPSTEALRKASEINTQIGIRYLQTGELQQAVRKLEKALKQDAGNADAHMTLGVVYERLDEAEQARAHYRRAIELQPRNSSALNNYGRFLCEHGEYDRAERLFLRSAENPTYESPQVPLANAGVCAILQGDTARAEDFFLRALKYEPRFPSALAHMAQLRFDGQHFLSARGYYQRYLAVAPQSASTLWLGIRLEHALGNEDAVASYKLLLKRKFPDSIQTRQLLEWEDDGRL